MNDYHLSAREKFSSSQNGNRDSNMLLKIEYCFNASVRELWPRFCDRMRSLVNTSWQTRKVASILVCQLGQDAGCYAVADGK
jgi:hypothetical protein